MAIQHAAKAEQRVPLYKDLVKVAENMVASARVSVEKLEQYFPPLAFQQPELGDLRTSLHHYIKLAEQVLDQTRRRVFDGETVPASEKIVSIFEPYADIIRKDRRDTLYGHKVFLTGGASGLIIDCVVERGNPTDSTKAVKLAERAIKVLGAEPEQIVFDGGFSSRARSNAPGSTSACATSAPASKASRSSSAASVGIAARGAPTNRFAPTPGAP